MGENNEKIYLEALRYENLINEEIDKIKEYLNINDEFIEGTLDSISASVSKIVELIKAV